MQKSSMPVWILSYNLTVFLCTLGAGTAGAAAAAAAAKAAAKAAAYGKYATYFFFSLRQSLRIARYN